MKYKRLNKDELLKLEKEFIDFLVVNGITADDWIKIKADENEKAEAIIDQFSDVVWEGVLREVNYIEHRSKEAIYCFHCEAKQIHLIKLHSKDKSVDFLNKEDLKEAITSPEKFVVHKASKAYNSVREIELFNLIRNGALISEGELFKTLNK